VAETNPGVFAANVKGSRATPSVAHAKQTLRSTRKTIADPSQEAAFFMRNNRIVCNSFEMTFS